MARTVREIGVHVLDEIAGAMLDAPMLAAQAEDRRYGRGFDTPIGALSVLRVSVAVVAAVVAFVVLSLPLGRAAADDDAPDGTRAKTPLLASLPARAAAAAAAFVVTLLVLAE